MSEFDRVMLYMVVFVLIGGVCCLLGYLLNAPLGTGFDDVGSSETDVNCSCGEEGCEASKGP